jgi:hypothetical protein
MTKLLYACPDGSGRYADISESLQSIDACKPRHDLSDIYVL